MRTLVCRTHNVEMVETELGGRINRRYATEIGDPRKSKSATGCALFRMRDPIALQSGQLYKNAITGRDAHSGCHIEEV